MILLCGKASGQGAASMAAEVDLWRVPLTADGDLRPIERVLSTKEAAVANQFKFERDRIHYILAHASLRQILAQYAGLAPHRLRFEYGASGKPRLAGHERPEAIEFNLSHSHDWGLIAVARGFAVGVDIEKIRPDLATAEIAEQFFSPNEQAALGALEEDRRVEAFFKCWTSKEAYIKGLGAGLSLPLKEFDVCVRPDAPAKLLRPHSGVSDRSSWLLHDVDLRSDYRAVLATARMPTRIMVHTWFVARNDRQTPGEQTGSLIR